MAYSASNPTDNNPLRTLAQVIRDNQDAVQALNDEPSFYLWSCHLADRTAYAFPNATPARIAQSVQLFSKQSATNNAELWFSDDQSTPNVIQMTESGRLGSATTPLMFETVRVDDAAGSIALDSRAICTASCRTTGTSSPAFVWNTSNIASVGVAALLYTITFAANAINPAVPFSVQITPISNNKRYVYIVSATSTSVTFRFTDEGGNNNFSDFFFQVFGGR